MHKLAIFVEGYTELLFADRLITEIGETHSIAIEHRKISGGGKSGKVPRVMSTIQAANINSDKKYFILIFDCGGDTQLKARILEEHQGLTSSGYFKIIGLRDVFPEFSYADIPRLQLGLKTYIKTSLIPVDFILSVMEIEAWFLSEINHFSSISTSIDFDNVKKTLGLDLINDDFSTRHNPAKDLDDVYKTGGVSYQKGSDLTINALDYTYAYIELPKKIPYLKQLCKHLDDFFSLA